MKLPVFWLLLIVALTACSPEKQVPGLFSTLPEFVATPDGMAITPDDTLVVACPNFANQSLPACLLKIGKDGSVRKWVDVPILPETGVACPMGIAFVPDGDLYVCDNQGWTGKSEGQFKGRILRLKITGNRIDSTIVVAEGMEHPNGIRVKNDRIYVTQSMLSDVKDSSGLLVSAVYSFGINDRNVKISNTLEDKNLVVTFLTENKFCQYGVDGLVFDNKGNLFVGNFGDGKLHRITFDTEGNVTGNTVFAQTNHNYLLDPQKNGFLQKATKAHMRTTDGICIDSNNNIYVADFSNNAINKVSPEGKISVVAQNGDTDGMKGEIDQPGEPIVWNGKIIVSNFDIVTGNDKVNSKHDLPATISVIELK